MVNAMMNGEPPSPEYLAEDRGYQLIIVASILIVLQILAVGARLYARRLMKAQLLLDDYLIIPALTAGLALCVSAILIVKVGHVGRHIEWVLMNDPAAIGTKWKITLAAELLEYPFAVTFAKLSILAFFNRLFSGRNMRKAVPGRNMRIAVWIVGVFVVANALHVVFVALFQCVPLQKMWDMSIKDGTCIDLMLWSRWISVPNIASDVALIVMPLPVIWRLQLSNARKLGLTFIFLFSGFNLVASCIRMSFFFANKFTGDPTWIGVELHSWSDIEGCTTVIAACLPSLSPLFKCAKQTWLHHKMTSMTRRALQGGSGGGGGGSSSSSSSSSSGNNPSKHHPKPSSSASESQDSNHNRQQYREQEDERKTAMVHPRMKSAGETVHSPKRAAFWTDLENGVALNRIGVGHDLRTSDEIPRELIRSEKEIVPRELSGRGKDGFF